MTGWFVAGVAVAIMLLSPSSKGRKYSFHNAPPLIFLIDDDSGKVWRFYRNMTNGVITSEGFSSVPLQ